jgi:hypothetical protein
MSFSSTENCGLAGIVAQRLNDVTPLLQQVDLGPIGHPQLEQPPPEEVAAGAAAALEITRLYEHAD